jgi:eukaryotic-like serine/threonine-protein kinase
MTSGPSSDSAVRPLTSGAISPAAEFQRRWWLGQAPKMESFVAEWPAISSGELAAVARVDLRQRWRRGEHPGAEEYLLRFVQLSDDAGLAVDLIYAEFLIREELGGEPSLVDFQRRYPQHAAELAAQVELHRALDVGDEQPHATKDTCQAEPASEPTLGPSAHPPSRFPSLEPNYEVQGEIGRGGMGVVYRARQVSLKRTVALKMVRAAECAGPELLSRFRAEAEAVARLHHPQIVQIYDYGEHEGLPYLALELMEGGTLAGHLNGTPWTARRAAALVETLARAVHFAHEQGVIHRDLKPANVLVSSKFKVQGSNSEPCLTNCELKITDFGLAKVFRDNASVHTQSGALLGTPSYMAPEQAAGRLQQIGPATDVYALGAILYELLTGHPPFRGETPIETLQQVLSSEPVSIRLAAPRLPRDLATICSKCLSREPQRRYSSAADLAGDLSRFLADQPIRARPISRPERTWLWCRRNPALAMALGTVAALLLCVAIVSTWYSALLSVQLQKTRQAEQAQRQSNQTAQLRLWDAYLAEIAARNSSRHVGQRFPALEAVDRAVALLDEVGPTPERKLQLRSATIASLVLPDLRRVRSWAGWPAPLAPVDFSPRADRYVVGYPSGEIILHQLSDGREVLKLQHAGPLLHVWISTSGQHLAVHEKSGITIWRIDGTQAARAWIQPRANQFAFAPDGTHAAISDSKEGMRLVELDSGQAVRSLGRGPAHSSFAFHAASDRVAVCGSESIQIISCPTGQVLTELYHVPLGDDPLAWHPSGAYLAHWTSADRTIALWDVQTGQRAMTLDHFGYAHRLAFGNDGSHLLSYSLWDENLKLWDVATGRKLLEMPSFPYHVPQVSDDGRLLLLAQVGERAELWEVALPVECRTLATALCAPLGICRGFQVSPDNRLLAAGRDRGFELWDLRTGKRLAQGPDEFCLAAFDGAGNLLMASKSGLYSWDRHEDPLLAADSPAKTDNPISICFGPPKKLSGPLVSASFTTNVAGDIFAYQEQDHWSVMRRSDLNHKLKLTTSSDARKAAVSDDRRYVAIANWNFRGAAIFDAASGRQVAELPVGLHGVPLFSPDSRWLATSPDGVSLWRTADWLLKHELQAQGTTPSGLGIAFSPDSRVLAIGQSGGVIRLIETETGRDLAQLSHPDLNQASVMAFSPDQTHFITLPLEAELPALIWDLAAIRRELARRGLDWPADVLTPHPSSSSNRSLSPLAVTLDLGNLLQQQEAESLLRRAGTSPTAESRDLIQRAADLDPGNAQIHNRLAWLLATGPLELRDADQSLLHARRAVALEPGNRSYINTLGVALYRCAQYDEAIRTLERSLELNRPQSGAYDLLFLALCHQAQGDAAAAHSYFAEATDWFDANRARLAQNWRDELTCLMAEARAIILP